MAAILDFEMFNLFFLKPNYPMIIHAKFGACIKIGTILIKSSLKPMIRCV